MDTYKINGRCTNCNNWVSVLIKKGTLSEGAECECPNCGVTAKLVNVGGITQVKSMDNKK